MQIATYRCPYGHDLELLAGPRPSGDEDGGRTQEPAFCDGCGTYYWVVTGGVTLVRSAPDDTPTMNLMAGLLIDRGRADQARPLLRRSLEASEAHGDLAGRALGLCHLARLHRLDGADEDARILFGDALATARTVEDEATRAAVLRQMGDLLAAGGELNRALALHQEALGLCEQRSDAPGAAASLHAIAALRVERGQVDEALWLCREALELQQRAGDERGRAATLRLMGGIHATRGQIDRSLQHYEQCLLAFDAARDPHGRATALGQMANLLADIGEIGEATKLLRESMSLNRQLGNPSGIAETMRKTASLMAAAGKVDGALRFFQRALSILEMTGNVRGQSAVCHEMGYQLSLRGRKDEARPYLERAHRLAAMVGDARGQATSLVRLAQMSFAADPGEAFHLLRESEQHLARLGAGRDLLDALQSHRSVARSARNASEFCYASANLVLVHVLRADMGRAAENVVHLAQKLPIERSDLVHQLTAFALLLCEKGERCDVVYELALGCAADLGLTLEELRELTPEVPTFVEREGALSWVETMLGEWLLATPVPLAAA